MLRSGKDGCVPGDNFVIGNLYKWRVRAEAARDPRYSALGTFEFMT